MSELISKEAFKVIEGRPVTSSHIVAEYFGKRHSDVVRAIDDLIEKRQEFQVLRNFARYSETVKLNDQGATRQVIAYWMDRKGFSILAMGFTGAKALEFKCAFYDEFERMEKALNDSRYVPAYLSDEQCWTIQSEVGKKAKGQGRHFQTIYRALKNHFKVPKYTHILAKDFDEAVRFIRELDFNVPVRTSRFNPEPDCRSLPRSDEAIPLFTRSECVRMMNFVYTMRYLFSDSFQAHYDMLCAVNSPLASKFYDAFHDVNLTLVEKTLASKGFDVREMDCYKSLMGTR